jgi:acetylornithine/succinyldiaminopimelate/putrescine aminotransferase
VLAKDTHAHTVRLAPPLTLTTAEADWLLERLQAVLAGAAPLRAGAPPPRRPASFAA